MFPEVSRQTSHDKSASQIDPGPPKAVTGAFSSNDDANWWMITLSDLTLLFLGFLVAWYVIDRKPIAAQQPPVLSAGIAQKPKSVVAANQSSRFPMKGSPIGSGSITIFRYARFLLRGTRTNRTSGSTIPRNLSGSASWHYFIDRSAKRSIW
jgi:hypothetical protein